MLSLMGRYCAHGEDTGAGGGCWRLVPRAECDITAAVTITVCLSLEFH